MNTHESHLADEHHFSRLTNAQAAQRRDNYHRTESFKTYTHPMEAARPSELEEENVGKDHNKVNTFNLYPYNDNYGVHTRYQEDLTDVTYHAGRNQTQNQRLPKYAIIVFVVAVCLLIGLMYWFFKAKHVEPDKIQIMRRNYQTVSSRRAAVGSVPASALPKGLIKAQGAIFQCPPPAFIYEDRCIRCPQSAKWNGTNCLMYKTPLEVNKVQ